MYLHTHVDVCVRQYIQMDVCAHIHIHMYVRIYAHCDTLQQTAIGCIFVTSQSSHKYIRDVCVESLTTVCVTNLSQLCS